MTDTAKYLNEFSRLENVLRETETAKSVLDYENSLQGYVDDIYDKLKLCRICRNYLSHHPDGAKFIVPTMEMTKFIKGLADEIESKKQHIKDIMVRQKALTLDTPIKDAVSMISKSKFGWAAITDKDGKLMGILDESSILSLVAKKQSLTGKLSTVLDETGLRKILKGSYIGITTPDDRAEDIYSHNFDKIIVCQDKIYKGIVK